VFPDFFGTGQPDIIKDAHVGLEEFAVPDLKSGTCYHRICNPDSHQPGLPDDNSGELASRLQIGKSLKVKNVQQNLCIDN